MGLFTDNNERKFLATQTNGEKRAVAYRIAFDGQVVITEVDGIRVTDKDPLPPQFQFVVLEWIDDHRRDLHTHADFDDTVRYSNPEIDALIFSPTFGVAVEQDLYPAHLFAA